MITAKAAPAVAYLGATIYGMSIPDWAALLACIYTLCLLAQMGVRWVQWFRARRDRRLDEK